MKADLHMHTTFSDGKYDFKEVIEIAKKANMDVIAITDHDSFFDYSCYQDGIKIVNGIELSTTHNDESIHVLGYFKDLPTKEFLDELEDMRNKRKIRAYKLVSNIEKYHGIKLDTAFIEKGNSITRGQISREIINQGYNYSKNYIFKNILGKDCPSYIPSIKIETKDGIEMIHRANGLAVLAHPMIYKSQNLLEILELNMLDGIEAIYPNFKEEEKKYRDIARKKNMFITAGSDFHEILDLTKDIDPCKHGNIGTCHLDDKDLEIYLRKVYER